MGLFRGEPAFGLGWHNQSSHGFDRDHGPEQRLAPSAFELEGREFLADGFDLDAQKGVATGADHVHEIRQQRELATLWIEPLSKRGLDQSLASTGFRVRLLFAGAPLLKNRTRYGNRNLFQCSQGMFQRFAVTLYLYQVSFHATLFLVIGFPSLRVDPGMA